jgi:hypothetical protein
MKKVREDLLDISTSKGYPFFCSFYLLLPFGKRIIAKGVLKEKERNEAGRGKREKLDGRGGVPM